MLATNRSARAFESGVWCANHATGEHAPSSAHAICASHVAVNPIRMARNCSSSSANSTISADSAAPDHPSLLSATKSANAARIRSSGRGPIDAGSR